MSVRDLQAGRLGRVLHSLSAAGLGIGERNEASRSGRTSPPTGEQPTDPNHRDDPRASSILRRLNAPQRGWLLAAIGEVERPRAASGETPSRDALDDLLADMGCQIDRHGPAAEPRIQPLADALRAARPVAAAVLASPAEPDVARARAFLHLARAAARQPRRKRDTLTAALART